MSATMELPQRFVITWPNAEFVQVGLAQLLWSRR